jgi:hypothetical protein
MKVDKTDGSRMLQPVTRGYPNNQSEMVFKSGFF